VIGAGKQGINQYFEKRQGFSWTAKGNKQIVVFLHQPCFLGESSRLCGLVVHQQQLCICGFVLDEEDGLKLP
jgi:hypothetical protein